MRRWKREEECASDGGGTTAASTYACRTMVLAFPAPLIFLCHFLRRSKAVLESGWCCAARSLKRTTVPSLSKTARTRGGRKPTCVCQSLIDVLCLIYPAKKKRRPERTQPPHFRTKTILLLLMLLLHLRVFLSHVSFCRIDRQAGAGFLIARQERHERRHFERQLLPCGKQRDRFGLQQLDVIIPGVELQPRADWQSRDLIDLLGI